METHRKTASLWEPDTPRRSLYKAEAVNEARKDPRMRDEIDTVARTSPSLKERNPEKFGLAGNVIKTLGAAAALGGTVSALSKLHTSDDIFSDLHPSDTDTNLIYGGLGAAAIGRLMQQPTSRNIASVSNDNYVPTDKENMNSMLNRSFRMGNKMLGQQNYTIDLDKAYDHLQSKKVASTDCENMPERDQPTCITTGFETENIPDRMNIPVIYNVANTASSLGFSKKATADLLNMITETEFTENDFSKVAGARVLTQAMKAIPKDIKAQAPDMINSALISDDSDYDVRGARKDDDPVTTNRFYQLLIPPCRR